MVSSKIVKQKKLLSGFTLIELLVVIGVLGILAAGVLVVVDPAEKMRQARDSKRKEIINTLGKAITEYRLNNNDYSPLATDFLTNLKNNGYLKLEPVNPSGTDYVSDCPPVTETNPWDFCPQCRTVAQNNICYRKVQGNPEVSAYVKVESQNDLQRCKKINSSNTKVFFIWHSTQMKTGYLCTTGWAPGIGSGFTDGM